MRRREVEVEEVCVYVKYFGVLFLFIYLDNSAPITDGCAFFEHATGLADF